MWLKYYFLITALSARGPQIIRWRWILTQGYRRSIRHSKQRGAANKTRPRFDN